MMPDDAAGGAGGALDVVCGEVGKQLSALQLFRQDLDSREFS